MVNFKSHYKTTPKDPYRVPGVASPPPVPQPPPAPRPVSLPRAPSIKINTKTPGVTAAAAGAPTPTPAAGGQSITATPVPRKPSINITKPARSSEAPVPTSAKRPHPDKEDGTPSTAKRPKKDTSGQSNGAGGPRRKSNIVTLKTRDPKRLALILGQPPTSQASSRGTPLPGLPKKEDSPEGVKDSIVAKPAARKPLPTGDRKPLPTMSGSSMSPPPPPPPPPATASVNANPRPSPDAGKNGSPSPSVQAPAPTGRPKIKIIRKSQSGLSQSPPVP